MRRLRVRFWYCRSVGLSPPTLSKKLAELPWSCLCCSAHPRKLKYIPRYRVAPRPSGDAASRSQAGAHREHSISLETPSGLIPLILRESCCRWAIALATSIALSLSVTLLPRTVPVAAHVFGFFASLVKPTSLGSPSMIIVPGMSLSAPSSRHWPLMISLTARCS